LLYANNGTGNYTILNDTTFEAVAESATAIGDLDNDGDNDIVMIGNVRFSSIFHIFSNQHVMVSLSENVKSKILVYPNPIKDAFQIETKGSIRKIAIYNQLGQLVYSRNDRRDVTISHLKPGLYFGKAYLDDGQILGFKIVKE